MISPGALIAAAVALLLAGFAGGYGYHRDELYFLAAGDHLAWGYVDQGPLTPFVARVMSEIAPASLTVLRLPSAIAAGLIVWLIAALAREFGGGRRAEFVAASCAAAAVVVLFTGHLLSTSTFDLLAWVATAWLAVRAVRTGDDRLWVAAGVVVGLGLLNKPLPAFLAFGLLAGVAVAGPRALLRNRWVWAAAGIALALWMPWLVWQADHGWPQLDVSREIAEGGSASSEPWWAIVPFQVLLFGPPLAVVWIAGLVRLLREPEMREFRFLGIAWIVLAVVFMASGGKPYYLAGLTAVLLAAGATPVARWLERGHARARVIGAGVVLSLTALTAIVISLPVLPTEEAEPVIAVNEDVAETIGWPAFTRQVAAVADEIPGTPVILTGNYGEAGAIDRFGPALGLPRARSGHNAYWDWGPPPGRAGPVVAVGLGAAELGELRRCRPAGRIDNGFDLDNEEQGAPINVCAGPRGTWEARWPKLRALG